MRKAKYLRDKIQNCAACFDVNGLLLLHKRLDRMSTFYARDRIYLTVQWCELAVWHAALAVRARLLDDTSSALIHEAESDRRLRQAEGRGHE